MLKGLGDSELTPNVQGGIYSESENIGVSILVYLVVSRNNSLFFLF